MKEIFHSSKSKPDEQDQLDDDTLTVLLDVHCWEDYGNKAFFGIFAKSDLE